MNRNVEIKARVASREAIERRVRDLADEGPVTLVQEDTLFVCPRGRLKLRRLGATGGERIYYCLLSTSPSPRDRTRSRLPSSA